MQKKNGAFALAVLIVVIVLGSLVAKSLRGGDHKQDTIVSAGTDAAMNPEAKKPETSNEGINAGTVSNSQMQAPSPTPAPETKTEARTQRVPTPVSKLMPSVAKERAEVAKDPHGTPESILKFSVALGGRLNSVKDDDEASTFMDELDQCVTRSSEEPSDAAKTLCLLNAKKLAKKFPSTEAKFANLEGRAGSDIRSNVGFFK